MGGIYSFGFPHRIMYFGEMESLPTKTFSCFSRIGVILFQGSHLWRRSGADQPIVIIEFKRPSRNDYTDEKDTRKQIYDYIRDLRDKKGALITSVGQDTPFFCYQVCDITPTLKALLEDCGIAQVLPGGRGFYGYNNDGHAFPEALEQS